MPNPGRRCIILDYARRIPTENLDTSKVVFLFFLFNRFIMKKSFILFLTLLTLYFFTYSQGCLPEGITFTSQQQIDNFQTNYPGCTEIEGDVNIGSYPPNNSITNLDSLCEITRINGWLWITYNNLLSDFSGLNSLEYCYDLQMAENNSVVNFEGFNSLDSISWYFSIANFDSLETVSGFNNLDYVGDNIFTCL